MAYYNGNKVGSVVRPPLGLIQKTATLGEPGWHFASEDNADGYSAVYLNAPTMGDLKMWVSGDSAVTYLMLGSDIDNVVANIGDLFPNLTTLVIGNDTLVVGGLDTALTNASNLTYIVVPSSLKNAYKAQYSGLASKFTSWAYDVEFTIPFIGDTELTIAYIQQVVAMASGDISQVTKVIVPSDFTSYEPDAFDYIFLKFTNCQEIEYGDIKLPTAYQEVEYIQSSGTQYIDTGVLLNQDSSVKMKYSITSTQNEVPFGCSSSGNRRFAFWASTDLSPASLSWHYGATDASLIMQMQLDTAYTVETRKNKLYVDDTLKYESTAQTFSCVNTSYIFARNGQSGADRYSHIKLYLCKIYDNGTLVRDFVPCYRKSDNAIGLYDTVNDVFYTNQGTVTFIKGNNLNGVIYRPLLSTCTIYYDENTSHTLTSAIVQNTLTRVPDFSTAERVVVPAWFTTYESGFVAAIQNTFANMSHLVTTYGDGTIDLDMNGDIVAKIVSIGKTVDEALVYARGLSGFDTARKFENDTNLIICPPFVGPNNASNYFSGANNLVYVPKAIFPSINYQIFQIHGNQLPFDVNAYFLTNTGSAYNFWGYGTTIPAPKRVALHFASGETFNITNNNLLGFRRINLENLILENYVLGFDISNATLLTRQALVDLFNSLGTPSTQQTLTIGATNLAKLTADDIAIATAKNWVVQ